MPPALVRHRPPLRARLRVPGDKSITHRALLFGALADGVTRVTGALDAEDTRATRRAVEALGARVEAAPEPHPYAGPALVVHGGPWRDAGVLDCGNSGTTARLLLGALAGRAGATLRGDDSLSRRPMRRVLEPLGAMGADIDGVDRLPLTVRRAGLRGIDHVSAVASAQVKGAVLVAGLVAEGTTRYREPAPTRDHTERLLREMGADLRETAGALELRPGRLHGIPVDVPGDLSAAAFWLCAAAGEAGAEVVVDDVGLNPGRTGVLEVLREMGALVEVETRPGVEPRGRVRVCGGGLRGVRIEGARVPRLIDELPALVLAALFAEGETVVADAAELRVKESDRVEAIVAMVRAFGGEAEAKPDGFVVRGGSARHAGEVTSRGDHRIAMAGVLLARRLGGRVDATACVSTSYPDFFRVLAERG